MSRKRIPLNQNGCTANFRIGVPFEQNLHTRKPQRGLLYKIKLILYLQRLVMWQWRHAADRLQLLRAVRGVVICDDRLSTNIPYVLSIFPHTRKHLDAVQAPLVVRVCDATSSLIFTYKNERTCARPYIFIILDHVFGRCLRHYDAGCTNKNL